MSHKPFTCTAIREGIYSESFPMYTAFFDLKNPVVEVKVPHAGSGPGITWAKIDELGKATARLVKEYADAPDGFRYRNQTMLLSGPKEWSLEETIKLLGRIVGKDVRIKHVGLEEHAADPVVRENMRPHGSGDPATDWTTVFEAVRKGETAATSGELQRLLGREPEGFEETVRAIMNG